MVDSWSCRSCLNHKQTVVKSHSQSQKDREKIRTLLNTKRESVLKLQPKVESKNEQKMEMFSAVLSETDFSLIYEGDGAFYGPKIDILTEDESNGERPVIIHRAVLGSVERMLSILIENYKGKWPLWLSPRQAIVCSVSEKSQAYAVQVKEQLHEAGYYVDVDISDKTVNKKWQIKASNTCINLKAECRCIDCQEEVIPFFHVVTLPKKCTTVQQYYLELFNQAKKKLGRQSNSHKNIVNTRLIYIVE